MMGTMDVAAERIITYRHPVFRTVATLSTIPSLILESAAKHDEQMDSS